MNWTAFGITDTGRQRGGNEDAFLVDPERGLFIVADGMGGHAAGDVASSMAVQAIEAGYPADTPLPDTDAIEPALRRAVAEANRAVLERASREAGKAGMGTTVTALALCPAEDRCVIAHIGDSRAYRLRPGEEPALVQLTRDHTWVQRQVDEGFMTAVGARHHPYSNILTRALGTEADVEIDLLRDDLAAGDLLLLCSDGLTGVLDDADLEAMLARELPLERLGEQLIEAANLRGGPDNITAVLVRVEP